MSRRLSPAFALAAAVVLAAGCSSHGANHDSSANGATALIGTFKLIAGGCSGAAPTGTYFRMIQPGGTVANGKYFTNPDSTCRDKSITAEKPGADGGLVTGTYQGGPAKAFDASGNALATSIVTPGSFTAIKFGISTNTTDPQTHRAVPAPQILVEGTSLSGQVTAWSAAWNNLYFNQGSPKPDGSRPGLTSPVTGTYDPSTHAFVLTWASQIVGGPFNGFSGYWHLQGTFVPAK
jgi:hypothetical protein